MSPGTVFAQTFDGQRAMLDLLARYAKTGHRPSVTELGDALGVHQATARRCALWLQAEGFVTVTRVSAMRTDIELIRNPGDDELRGAVAGRRADR